MIVEIKYDQCNTKLKRVLIREFDDNISEAKLRNEVLWEILCDLGVYSYEISFDK